MKKSEKNHLQNLTHCLFKIKIAIASIIIINWISFIYHKSQFVNLHLEFRSKILFAAKEEIIGFNLFIFGI